MPRGAKPGERRGGGRKPNQRNRATLQREQLAEHMKIAEAEIEEMRAGKKMAKTVLEEFMVMFSGLAAAFQPLGTGPSGTVTAADMEAWAGSKREGAFERYAKLAMKTASDLADYQSPKFAAVHVAAPPPERGQVKKKFTIGIFDNQGRKAPRHIDVKATRVVTKPASTAVN